MRIGELAKRTGASIRSLRYYDNMGLLGAKRMENGYREFDDSAVRRVQSSVRYDGVNSRSRMA